MIYGVDSEEALNIFNINLSYSESKKIKFNKNKSIENIISISIGDDFAKNYSLNVGDIFSIFSINVNELTTLPSATKVQVSHIFDSGFSEYDKSVSFISLTNSRLLFDYGSSSTGIVGIVKDPININKSNFNNTFKDINGYRLTTWVDRHKGIFEWLDVYADPILFIIFLITILAIVNMSLSVWILLQDRLKELSILFAIGFTKIKILFLVIFQNIILTSISLLTAGTISFLLLLIQDKYQLVQVSEKIYFVDYLPVTFDYAEVFQYYLILFFLSILTSFIPAFKLYYLNITKHLNANG